MEQEHSPQSTGLESQLRNMILGNVSMTGEQVSRDQHPTHRGRGRGRGQGQGQGRGRGRGRGGFRPAADGNNPNYTATDQNQNQGWRAHASANTPFTRGSIRGHSPNQRYQYPPRNFPNVSQSGGPPDNRQQHSTQYRPPTGPAYPQRSRPQGPYAPGPHLNQPYEDPTVQIQHLDNVAAEEVPKVEMSVSELESKEKFRQHLETIMKEAFAKEYSGDIATISLVGFGSLASGFGMPGSDMDLAVVPCWKDPARANEHAIGRSIPRLLERAVLDAKYGGRLLTRTRVPILKICQTPTEALYAALAEERQKWDELPREEKFPSDQPQESSPPPKPKLSVDHGGAKAAGSTTQTEKSPSWNDFSTVEIAAALKDIQQTQAKTGSLEVNPTTKPEDTASNGTDEKAKKGQHREKQWTREKVMGPLDFPKTGCGIQCDINFENPLGIHNTQMLRCYSLTDPRVRPMVLFVKSWAKRRKVNSAYSGTLSSYGWVLMVLHYLVNVATPPVCPNLQHSVPLPSDAAALEEYFKSTKIAGYEVRFWRNEQDINRAAQAGRLSQNTQSIGALLRGFFQYYASLSGYGYPKPPQFYWTNEVLSLRTPGGILSKQSKGWVSATTKVTAEKKVTNRYLFAIEDPFETDHNVARTVTHRGIVAIRDEFRRAWRIIRAIGQGVTPEGGIFDEVVENPPPPPEPKPEGTPNTPLTD